MVKTRFRCQCIQAYVPWIGMDVGDTLAFEAEPDQSRSAPMASQATKGQRPVIESAAHT